MTRTYYHRSAQLATGIHATTDPANEKEQNATAGGGVTSLSESLGGGDSSFAFAFTTPSGVPGVADWPSGTYDCYLDVSTAGADISYGMRAAGAVTGHFARVDAGLTSDLQTQAQTETLFTGTGVKHASTGTWDPTAGSDTDRFEVLVAATRAASHGSQTLTIDVEATDASTGNGGVSVGPWADLPVEQTGSDTGTGADASTLSGALTVSDSGTGSDTSVVDTGPTLKSGSDSGTGTDAATLTAVLVATDAGTGSDASTADTGSTPKSGTDTATGADLAWMNDVTPGDLIIARVGG